GDLVATVDRGQEVAAAIGEGEVVHRRHPGQRHRGQLLGLVIPEKRAERLFAATRHDGSQQDVAPLVHGCRADTDKLPAARRVRLRNDDRGELAVGRLEYRLAFGGLRDKGDLAVVIEAVHLDVAVGVRLDGANRVADGKDRLDLVELRGPG